jgi:hypothetical protein
VSIGDVYRGAVKSCGCLRDSRGDVVLNRILAAGKIGALSATGNMEVTTVGKYKKFYEFICDKGHITKMAASTFLSISKHYCSACLKEISVGFRLGTLEVVFGPFVLDCMKVNGAKYVVVKCDCGNQFGISRRALALGEKCKVCGGKHES